MKKNGATTSERKIKMTIIAALLVLLVDIASVIMAARFFYIVFPKLLHVGDKLNQIGVNALIGFERDTVLLMVPAFSLMLFANLGLIFLLQRELKLNTNKSKSVRAEGVL